MPYLADIHDPNFFRPSELSIVPSWPKKSSTMNGNVQKLTSFPSVELVESRDGVTCLEDVSSDRLLARDEMEVDGGTYFSPPSWRMITVDMYEI